MRYLIASLFCLLAQTASAVDYAYSRMNANAVLVLTDDAGKCLFGKSGYLFSMTGTVLFTHCWEPVGDEIRVSYSDGTHRMYPKSMFSAAQTEPKVTY